MKTHFPLLVVCVALLIGSAAAHAQLPLTPGYTPAQRSTQLPTPLYVRIAGPAGMKVTFYRGVGKGTTLETPATVGLRPGYVYRLAVSDMVRFPGQVFYPTLEVRGSLFLADKLKTSDYPAGLFFTEEDFTKAQNGAVIKKVIFLERTDTAWPQASRPEEPIELTVLPNRDPLFEARDRGLPLLVLYMGHRELSEDELVGIPGTVLLPGEKVLPPPRQLPWMPWACYPVYDPLAGAAPPWPYYRLPDGGDSGSRVGFDNRGQLRGLDPSDTVAEYEDSKGNRRVAVSNRVNLLVPRFLVARSEMILGNEVVRYGTGRTQGVQGQFAFNASQPVHVQHQNEHLEQARDRVKAGGADNLFGTSVTGRIEGLDVKARVSFLGVIDGHKPPPLAAEPADRPLRIIKWPDKSGGVIGDIITFFVRFTNTGGQSIANVDVSDNLVTRYEYVPGSARADRETSFTTQPNEVGSLVLRWEFPGALLPGESGLVSFQVKIR